MDDQHWLAQYVEQGSQRDFARLVERHAGLVYSAALRQVKDAHLAEDITQATFIALAKRAKSLRKEVAISAWLLVTARYLATNALKARSRRRKHEQQAAAMAKETTPRPADPMDWDAISPHLDAALASLSKPDRRAIALRYFEGLALDEVARKLGITPAAARQRVHRATLRMRAFFAMYGAEITPAHLRRRVRRMPGRCMRGRSHGSRRGITSTSCARRPHRWSMPSIRRIRRRGTGWKMPTTPSMRRPEPWPARHAR